MGLLGGLRESQHTFALKVKGGRTLRGFLPDTVSAYRHLLNERVVVEGRASFRPEGGILLIHAVSLREATEADTVWETLPRPAPRTVEEIAPRRPLPGGKSGFAHLLGKWSGTETDEEIADALEELG